MIVKRLFKKHLIEHVKVTISFFVSIIFTHLLYQGRTTIVIAHRLHTIENAHHIYVLDKGNVIEEGTHETLMRKEDGKYQQMVKSQQIDGINDDGDKDDMMDMTKAIEEDVEQICMFSSFI